MGSVGHMLLRRGAFGLGLLLVWAFPALVHAAPVLSVNDLGQIGELSQVPQPAVSVSASGTCATPFTVESSCPAGDWPGIGGEWGSMINVAGGDELQFVFSSPVQSVSVASTTYPTPPTSAPPGVVLNEDMIPPTSAVEAGGDGATWMFTLPQLNPRAWTGLTFSVVATDAAGSHDYPLSISSPRIGGNPSASCGAPFYYNTGEVWDQCVTAAKSPPVGGPGRRETTSEGSASNPPGTGAPTVKASNPVLRLIGDARWGGKHSLRLVLSVPFTGRIRIALRNGAHRLGFLGLSHVNATRRLAVTIDVSPNLRGRLHHLQVSVQLIYHHNAKLIDNCSIKL